MKKIKIKTSFDVFEIFEELPLEIQEVFYQAKEARKNAYAPYSEFEVGVGILLENGKIIVGSNQENAAYPSGLCAERVAIFSAGSTFPNVKIKALVITATSRKSINTEPIPPCGACRQAIAEYEIKQEEPIQIYFMGAEGKIILANSIKDLLPLIFDKKFL